VAGSTNQLMDMTSQDHIQNVLSVENLTDLDIPLSDTHIRTSSLAMIDDEPVLWRGPAETPTWRYR
jgi:hypothetical protein